MKPDDFFEVLVADDTIEAPETTRVLNEALVQRLRVGPIPHGPDITVIPAFIALIHREYEAFGTGNHQTITLEQSALVLKVAKVAVRRVGLELPELPFRDFDGFYRFWKREGMSNSYAARRDYLDVMFKDLEDQLYVLEERRENDELAQPIVPEDLATWPGVVAEVEQLRQRFIVASTPQDYSAIGVACVRILIALGKVTYDPSRHLRSGEAEPSPDKTKQRLTRVIEDTLPGEDNVEMRRLVDGAIEVAHKVKHSTTPTRREAGIAADSVILLVSIMKRIVED